MFNKSTFCYAVLVLANAIVVSIHCMQPQNEVARLKNISAYIGSHAYTPEYSFQERLRKNDLAIKQLVEKTMSPETANALFVNGWGQVLGALLAFQNCNISNNFKTQDLRTNIKKDLI